MYVSPKLQPPFGLDWSVLSSLGLRHEAVFMELTAHKRERPVPTSKSFVELLASVPGERVYMLKAENGANGRHSPVDELRRAAYGDGVELRVASFTARKHEPHAGPSEQAIGYEAVEATDWREVETHRLLEEVEAYKEERDAKEEKEAKRGIGSVLGPLLGLVTAPRWGDKGVVFSAGSSVSLPSTVG